MFQQISEQKLIDMVGILGVKELAQVIYNQTLNNPPNQNFTLQTMRCRVAGKIVYIHIESILKREEKSVIFQKIYISDVKMPDGLLDRYNQLTKEVENYTGPQKPVSYG
jgi:hypothetical protein